jgi:hypothetical protein
MGTRATHVDSITVLAALCGALLVGGCQKQDAPVPTPKTASIPTDETRQTVTAPPPGDSTPKAADENTEVKSEATDAAGRSGGAQSTVGTAASGAPPYTLGSAPEGNKAPQGGNAPKK